MLTIEECQFKEARPQIQYGVRRLVAAFDLDAAVMKKNGALNDNAAVAKSTAATSRRTPY